MQLFLFQLETTHIHFLNFLLFITRVHNSFNILKNAASLMYKLLKKTVRKKKKLTKTIVIFSPLKLMRMR